MLKIIALTLLAVALGNGRPAYGAGVTGTFIQLNRAAAARTADQWKSMLNAMKAAGINILIIQWTAETPVLYFNGKDLDFKEKYDVVERIMEAAGENNFSFILGLQNDPAFWKEITARDKALRDYFLVRLAQNERLQKALLKTFGKRKDWIGYYIPDELDDLSWRAPDREQLLKDYLSKTIQVLRTRDPDRSIAISAFFRARTAPAVFTEMLRHVTRDIGLNYLLIQDGAGGGDPPLEVTPMYYRSLLGDGPWREPVLWVTIETFRQTSARNEPFTAGPAPAERFSTQIQTASGFERRILFTFPDYVAPERGPAAKALYEFISGIPAGP